MYDLVKLLFVSSLLGFMYYYVTKNVSGIYIAVLLVILAVSVIFYSALSRVKQFSRAQIEQIDEMSGEQFEDYTKFLLNKLGYSNVKVTPNVGD